MDPPPALIVTSTDRLCLRCQSVGKPAVPGLRYALGLGALVCLVASPLLGEAGWFALAGCAGFLIMAFTRPGICARCQSGELVPVTSPVAQRLLGAVQYRSPAGSSVVGRVLLWTAGAALAPFVLVIAGIVALARRAPPVPGTTAASLAPAERPSVPLPRSSDGRGLWCFSAIANGRIEVFCADAPPECERLSAQAGGGDCRRVARPYCVRYWIRGGTRPAIRCVATLEQCDEMRARYAARGEAGDGRPVPDCEPTY